ncbi:MAG: FCD domain-containing protein [Pseudomonadota bacterium]
MLWGLKPVEQRAAHGLARERLKRFIHVGFFLPGERMASERRLAEQIGISRVTLREALGVLEAEGYVQIRRGASGGAFVAGEDALKRMADNQFSAQPATALRVLEYRDHAEPEAARLAAMRRSPADLKQIGQAIDGLRRAATLGEIRRSEAAFHLSVAQASGNPFFAASIEDAMALMFLPFPSGDPSHEADASHRLRLAVADAVDARNEPAAARAMQDVLTANRERMPRRQVA